MEIFKCLNITVLYTVSGFLCFLLAMRDVLVLKHKEELLIKYPALTELFWLKSDPYSTEGHLLLDNGIVLQLILYCFILIAIRWNHRCLIVPWLVADGILTSILSSCIMAYIFRHDEFDSVPLVCSVLAGFDILFWVVILDLHLRITQTIRVQFISIIVSSRPKINDSPPTNIDYKNLNEETKENC